MSKTYVDILGHRVTCSSVMDSLNGCRSPLLPSPEDRSSKFKHDVKNLDIRISLKPQSHKRGIYLIASIILVDPGWL